MTIVERLGSDDTTRQTRHALVVDKKIIGSDDYFAIPAPLDDFKTVGILGAGGAAWDAALHAIESGKAEKVVVFGNLPDALTKNAAFKNLKSTHGSKICNVTGTITNVKYESVEKPVFGQNIVIQMGENGNTGSYGDNQFSCSTLAPQSNPLPIDRIDKLVEAFGRDEGGTPEVLKPLVTTNGGISYEICKKGKKWVGARVVFGTNANNDKNSPPQNLYLVGAMAASALKIKAENNEWKWLLKEFSDKSDLQNEHPPHGFAGAAYTGSQLVQCFDNEGKWKDSECNCTPRVVVNPNDGGAK